MKCRVLIEQAEDGMFVAEVPSLPGCNSLRAIIREVGLTVEEFKRLR